MSMMRPASHDKKSLGNATVWYHSHLTISHRTEMPQRPARSIVVTGLSYKYAETMSLSGNGFVKSLRFVTALYYHPFKFM